MAKFGIKITRNYYLSIYTVKARLHGAIYRPNSFGVDAMRI